MLAQVVVFFFSFCFLVMWVGLKLLLFWNCVVVVVNLGWVVVVCVGLGGCCCYVGSWWLFLL